VPDQASRGLLDTSVIIDLEDLPVESLPVRGSVSALTLAELAAGPHATSDPVERAKRQNLLQSIETRLDVVPFDDRAARSYALVFVATAGRGRKPGGPRLVDLLIASTAVAESLPLYTRNATDLAGLEQLLEVHVV
jgi:predicted nucleic acid-binding protein